jgi:transposase
VFNARSTRRSFSASSKCWRRDDPGSCQDLRLDRALRHAPGLRPARTTRESLAWRGPQSGSLFVFSNRGTTRLKVLWFDSNGYCLLYKRLHRAVFELPASSGGASIQIDARRLAELLHGLPHICGARAPVLETPKRRDCVSKLESRPS